MLSGQAGTSGRPCGAHRAVAGTVLVGTPPWEGHGEQPGGRLHPPGACPSTVPVQGSLPPGAGQNSCQETSRPRRCRAQLAVAAWLAVLYRAQEPRSRRLGLQPGCLQVGPAQTCVCRARATQVSILGNLVRSGDKLPSVYLI